jgi:hypothetical protein
MFPFVFANPDSSRVFEGRMPHMAVQNLHLRILAIGLPVFFAGLFLVMILDAASSRVLVYGMIFSFCMLLLGGLASIAAAGIWAWRSPAVEVLVAAGVAGIITLLLAWFGVAGGLGELNPHSNPGFFISVISLFLSLIATCGLFVLIALITFGRQIVSGRRNTELAKSPPKS